MIMSNYLGVATLGPNVMATERPGVGIAHYTVVPENFKSSEAASEPADSTVDRAD